MEQIYIFAGTTEGRRLAQVLSTHDVACTVSVATEYGAQTMEEAGVPANVTVRTGRLNREQIAEMLKSERFACVVDATHPYAVEAAKAIRGGCGDTGVKYLRLSRETTDRTASRTAPAAASNIVNITTTTAADRGAVPVDITSEAVSIESREDTESRNDIINITQIHCSGAEDTVVDITQNRAPGCNTDVVNITQSPEPLYVDTLEQALSWLSSRTGNILSMTGSKEIGKIAAGIGDRSRLFARVLPSVESIQLCEAAGLTGKQILAMQGPFSEEMNLAMLHSAKAEYLLTKETGKAGGFFEKLTAAKAAGVQAVVVKNPERENAGLSFAEVLGELEKLLKVSLIDA